MSASRREFIGTLAAAASATMAASARTRAADAPDSLPVIDSHQHLWDLKKFNLPWIRRGDAVLDRDYLMNDYLEATRGLNVVKAVYMEVAVEPAQRLAEAEWVVEICKRGDTPTVAAVIGGSPESDDFPRYVRRFREGGYVKGIRQSFRRGSASDDAFIKGLRFLGELGMSFDLLGDSGLLAEMVKVVHACPDTRFIVDHCGNPDLRLFNPREQDVALVARRLQWQEGMTELAKRKNVVCKISGIVEGAALKPTAERAAAPINFCLEAFGADRVMFSGNWPVCLRTAALGEWVGLLKEVVRDRPVEDQRRLFHDNAAKFYGLA
jgi:predicted TIM-barrel fold metal-dependent hydrolase